MSSEKRQTYAILGILALLLVTVLCVLIIGADFLFIRVDGLLSRFVWATPILMIFIQQFYAIPAFMQRYWKVFSEEPPSLQERFVPFVNEVVVYESPSLATYIYAGWGCVFVILALTYFGAGSFLGRGDAIESFTFYSLFLALVVYLIICAIRGAKYLSIRRDIYDLHNKYLGVRGESPFFWAQKIMYFIPLLRSLSLLMDLQVLDKLSNFNNIDAMRIELREDSYE